MKRAGALLASVLAVVSSFGVMASPVVARTADVWSNSDAFTSTCLGFTDTYPRLMYNQAKSQLAKLGYSPVTGALGAAFTRTAFLNEVFYDYGVYVHTHGDNYWATSGAPTVDSAFMQDPGSGKCNTTLDLVRSSAIKSATMGTPYNMVVMSTCYLGSSKSTMPGAFQIEKVQNSTQREFYLGYTYSTYDSAAYRFEGYFFSYLNGVSDHSRTVYQAFVYALGRGGYEAANASNPFAPNWWGNPNYNGTAG
jgi:hypothetical protein